MKKVFFIFAVITSLAISSCSKDDDGGGNTGDTWFTAKINGEEFFFEDFNVEPEVFPEYTDLHLTAKMIGDEDNWIEIVIEEGATGPDASWRFVYYIDGEAYEKEDGFVTEIDENTDTKMSGNFSGTVLRHDGTGDPISITEGSFSINR